MIYGEENDPFTIALVCTDKITSDKEHDYRLTQVFFALLKRTAPIQGPNFHVLFLQGLKSTAVD